MPQSKKNILTIQNISSKKIKYKKTLINVKYDLLRFDTWEKIDIFATVNLNII